MPQWKEAPAVAEIANMLIENHHPHLDGMPFRYLFVDQAKKKHGKFVWAETSVQTGRVAYLSMETGYREFRQAGAFFLIEVGWNVWNDLSDEQKFALVDHELSHCAIGDEDALTVNGHDVEEFASIIRRHGYEWRDGLRRVGEAILDWHGQAKIAAAESEEPPSGKTRGGKKGAAPAPEVDPAVVSHPFN